VRRPLGCRCADKHRTAAAVPSGECAAEEDVVVVVVVKTATPPPPVTYPSMARTAAFFSRPWAVFGASIAFRAVLLIYGRWQDANSPVKYTDIDYLVFTDASRYLATNNSPYDRATYRYTPLLAWLLYPTTWGGLWFEFGKGLFAAGDVVTGWLIFRILRGRGMSTERSMKFASIWLLNPMVANISTRGSSEGLVVVIVVALLWAALQKRVLLAGCLLGFGVHLKIYPFIYAASIFWWLDSVVRSEASSLRRLLSYERVVFAFSSLLTFMTLNGVMYMQYVIPDMCHLAK
jgi:phosphatidylinositol glycan class M